MPFGGLRVLSLESRRSSEIDLLIRKQGGESIVAPSLKERALEDHSDAFRLLDGLEAGRYELLVLMTGVGLSFWRDVVAARFSGERADNALRKVRLLARGPKPSAVLRTIGLAPDITVPEPNTWREIVEVMKKRPERRVAIQEYGRPNPELVEALRESAIDADTFAFYRWDLPDDTGPLRRAVERLASKTIDVVLFTSSIQLEHLISVAAEAGLREQVIEALRTDTATASIGPIMTAALLEQGLTPDIVPASPKMGPLVKAAADEASAVLLAKRGQRG